MTQEIIINNNRFILRNATDEDYDFTFNLTKENMLDLYIRNWGFWNEKSFKENFKKENIRILQFEDINIGFIDFKFKKDCGYLNEIQLIKKFQNKGIGTYLMKILESETLIRGFNKIRLKTFKDNPVAKLYKTIGYVPISEYETSYIMEKTI